MAQNVVCIYITFSITLLLTCSEGCHSQCAVCEDHSCETSPERPAGQLEKSTLPPGDSLPGGKEGGREGRKGQRMKLLYNTINHGTYMKVCLEFLHFQL